MGSEDRTIIERAFELARECGSLVELRERLRGEGFTQVEAHLSGRLTRTQLRDRLDPRRAAIHRDAKRNDKREA